MGEKNFTVCLYNLYNKLPAKSLCTCTVVILVVGWSAFSFHGLLKSDAFDAVCFCSSLMQMLTTVFWVDTLLAFEVINNKVSSVLSPFNQT